MIKIHLIEKQVTEGIAATYCGVWYRNDVVPEYLTNDQYVADCKNCIRVKISRNKGP